MIDDLTYDEFAALMQRYEKATKAQIDKAWAAWSQQHSPKYKRTA